MAWLIVCEDGPDGAKLRADRALMDAHWAHEQSIKQHILCAGSLRSDDGTTPLGGLLILDIATRDEALALFNADPATRAGLRHKVTVKRWNKAIFAGAVCD